MSKDPYKVVLLGESGVGKTCILNQFTEGKFDPYTPSSITVNFKRKTIKLPEGKTVTFDIWDTAGQEKYRSITEIFYKDVNAIIILVYDVTVGRSFFELKEYWYEQIKQLENKDRIIAIVANKSDLYEKRQLSNEIGEEFAKGIGAIFASVSAEKGSDIQSLFNQIGQKIIEYEESRLIRENEKLNNELYNLKEENKKLKIRIKQLKEANDANNEIINKLLKEITNFNDN